MYGPAYTTWVWGRNIDSKIRSTWVQILLLPFTLYKPLQISEPHVLHLETGVDYNYLGSSCEDEMTICEAWYMQGP